MRAPTRACIELRVPPDLRALRGHFAQIPIVPGVIHAAWALHFARTELGLRGRLEAMDNVKFRRIVRPGHQLSLSLDWDPARRSLCFTLAGDDGLHSSGRLVLSDDDA